ncbi:hypothetical protein QF041_000541 [Paenibacillus sp. W2I17]|nr:hypothetical protein [Paenibacillus sp. W2I17]
MKLKEMTKKRHLWSLFLKRTKKEPNAGFLYVLHENVIAGGFDSNMNQRIDH